MTIDSDNRQPPSSMSAPGAEQPMVGSGATGLGQPNHQGADDAQQQQFESEGSGQHGAIAGSFAGEIQPHMSVIGADGASCGTVDHLDGDRIKLTRDASGEHRYIPLGLVQSVSGTEVRLRERGDQAFGINGE